MLIYLGYNTCNSWHTQFHTRLLLCNAFNVLANLYRGMMDEEGNQFVAYFLPTEETMKKRKRDQEEDLEYNDEDV